jgi:hypothetical protein
MAEVTYFVALPFVAADDGIAAGEPTECFNPTAVVMRAEALSRKPGHVGAVAFSRTGDPATGDFGEMAYQPRRSGGYRGMMLVIRPYHASGCLFAEDKFQPFEAFAIAAFEQLNEMAARRYEIGRAET